MTGALEMMLLAAAGLLLLSILASKASGRLGVPALLVFLLLGMLAGSEGPGGIFFNEFSLAQRLGVIALIFILFSGGLDTHWSTVARSWKPALTLATAGVAITAGVIALLAHFTLGITILEGFLLGAIVSSTDAAATFAILRGRGVNLPPRLRGVLELESGSNDPMAVFLTTSAIALLLGTATGFGGVLIDFVLQMGVGALFGIGLGRVAVWFLNQIDLEYEGLYPVATIALVPAIYSLTSLSGGNGFLAVYVAGLVMAGAPFLKKRTLKRFHDGVAWLMQITMFVALGLLVYPSRLVPVWRESILIALFLVFVARPIAVYLPLIGSALNLRERTLVAWSGLRGAVPIILGTFPLLAGVRSADVVFDIVFFVVLTSVLLQGTTIAPIARWLGVEEKPPDDAATLARRGESDLVTIEAGARVAGRRLVEIEFPAGTLVMLIYRAGAYFVPEGSTHVERGDRLLLFTSKASIDAVRALLSDAAETG
jgi:cell volume regulation protein A